MKDTNKKKYGLVIFIILIIIGVFAFLYTNGFLDFNIKRNNIVLIEGEIFQLNGDEYENITWECSDENIAIINENREIVAKNTGKATITILKDEKKIAIYIVGVTPSSNSIENTNEKVITNNDIEIDNITINSHEETIIVGNSVQLIVTITPSNATNKTITWTSSDTNVATVSNGVVTAKKEGSATITAKTNNGKIAECKIIVKEKVSTEVVVTGVSLDNTSVDLEVGKTIQLGATITPNDATNKTITWTSSDISVAMVSNGVVTAKKKGNATITVKTNNGISATCKITVKETTTYPLTADGICESVKTKNSIDYADFKELSKLNNNDDYYAIKAAHDCANKYNKTVVVTKGEYNIYKYVTSVYDNRIIVRTDTDLGNSTIYIHDENIVLNGDKKYSDYIYELDSGDGIEYKAKLSSEIEKGGVFSIPNDIKQKALKIVNSYNEGINGYFVLLENQNTSKEIFIRSGSNENDDNTSLVKEVFQTDTNGKILDNITWKYKGENVRVVIRPISSRKLTFKNGNFVNITSSNYLYSGYIKRCIKISRSNALLSNIKHMYVNTSKQQIYRTNYSYHGFYNFQQAADVTLENSTTQGLRSVSPNNSKGHRSTYDIHIISSSNITFKNVTMSDKEMDMIDNGNNLWGVTIASFAKNIIYEGCKLNRIDTHQGVHNLTVRNTIIGQHALTQIGFGKLIIDNVTVKHSNVFIHLRGDYGSTWNGEVTINGNNVLIPDNSDDTYLISVSPKSGHNYGYDLYIPDVHLKTDATITVKSNTNTFNIFDKSSNYFSAFKTGGGFQTHYSPTFRLNGTVYNNSGVITPRKYASS